jgi:hypothetical protein
MGVKNRGEFLGIATVDVCINLVLVFAVLLKLSLLAINVESAESAQKRVKSNALSLPSGYEELGDGLYP